MQPPQQMYSQQSPPVVFNNLDVSPQLAQYVPAMTSELANVISMNANKNQIRQQHFQVMSAGNWQNQNFLQAQQFAMDMLQLGINKGFFQDIGSAIARTATDAALMLCSVFAVSNPQILQSVSREVQASTQQAVQAFNASFNEINAFKAQSRQMPNQMQGQFGGAPMQAMSGGYAINSAMNQNPIQQRFVGSNMPGMPGASQPQIFGYGNNPSQPNQPGVSTGPTRPSSGLPPAFANQVFVNQQPVQPQPQIQQQPTPVVAIPQAVKTVSVKDWTPFLAQPYLPLINPEFQILGVRTKVGRDGKQIVEAYVDQKEQNVDREAHQIGMIQRAVIDRVNPLYTSRSEANSLTLREISQTYQSVTDLNDDQAHQKLAASNVICPMTVDDDDNNLHSAIQTARFYRAAQKASTKGIGTAFTVPIYIKQTFLTEKDNNAVFSEFKNYKNFKAVAQFLKQKLASAASDYSVIENIAQIDHYLTDKLNDLLHNKLGLHNLTSSTFIEDVSDLEPCIKEYGSIYLDKYLAAQEDFINLYISNPEMEEIEVDIAGNKSDVCTVNFYCLTYITLLGVLENELSVDIPDDKAVAVLAGSHPALYEFISTMLKNVGKNKQGKAIAELYIVTMDDNVYQIHEGLIGHEFYLISRVS